MFPFYIIRQLGVVDDFNMTKTNISKARALSSFHRFALAHKGLTGRTCIKHIFNALTRFDPLLMLQRGARWFHFCCFLFMIAASTYEAFLFCPTIDSGPQIVMCLAHMVPCLCGLCCDLSQK